MNSIKAAAHLITVHAEGLGGPEIIVLTRDEGRGAEEIIRYPFGSGGVEAGSEVLRDAGWSVTSTWTKAARGYLIADVEKDA